MENIILTACIGILVGIFARAGYDILCGKKSGAECSVPAECTLRLDRLLEQHSDIYEFMDNVRGVHMEQTIVLKQILAELKEISTALRANETALRDNGVLLREIIKNGKEKTP